MQLCFREIDYLPCHVYGSPRKDCKRYYHPEPVTLSNQRSFFFFVNLVDSWNMGFRDSIQLLRF